MPFSRNWILYCSIDNHQNLAPQTEVARRTGFSRSQAEWHADRNYEKTTLSTMVRHMAKQWSNCEVQNSSQQTLTSCPSFKLLNVRNYSIQQSNCIQGNGMNINREQLQYAAVLEHSHGDNTNPNENKQH
jgi:hypothetical protein